MNRILLITDIFPPDIGGPATFIRQLAQQLAEQGHTVTVVCTSQSGQVAADEAYAFRVRRIVRRPRSVQHSLRVRAILAQEILRHTLVFANGLEYPTFQMCRILQRKYALKVVGDWAWENARNTGLTTLSIDEFQSAPPAGKPWEHLVEKRSAFARGAWRVITPSDYLRRLVIGWGVAPERAITVLNGIPLAKFAAFNPRHRVNYLLQIVFVGRLTSWKGVDTLLHAVSNLRDVRVYIVGDGPEMSPLRLIADALRVQDRVVFTGAQPHDQVQSFLMQADVLVLVSSYEGLSHTLLEAAAIGVPCIASDCGGNPEVICNGKNGLLVPYGDAVQLRGALVQLQTDEELRFRLAIAAKESARRFDFDVTVQKTIQTLLSETQ